MPSPQAPTSTDAPNTAPLEEGSQPRSAAARRAAGEKVSQVEGDAAMMIDESGEPAPGPQQQPTVMVDEMPISADELRAFRAFRNARSTEIAESIAAAPVAIGTDINPYTLVHLRGCPQPMRTETYEQTNPAGHVFTVHRCIECGAHLTVPH